MQFPIYLDYNATTPVDERVIEEMLPFFTKTFGNAASNNHFYGWQAAEAVQIARERVASLINANPKEIIFTSGATEAINLALKGIYKSYSKKGNHIITCTTEHNAVLDTCRFLEKNGATVTYIPVDNTGLINIDLLREAILPSTTLIAVMYANNETGVIQPVKEIGKLANEKGVFFFCDATQAIGKLVVNVELDFIDLMAFSSHKIYGPKGAGALFIKKKSPRIYLEPLIHGGGHENNVRSGTLNVPGIAGFGKACSLCIENSGETNSISALHDFLEAGLLKINDSFVNGVKALRLPNTTNIIFPEVNKNQFLTSITKMLAISTGSACTSSRPEPSHVLEAMNISKSLASLAIRISLGRFTSKEDINFAGTYISETVKALRH